MRTFEKQSFSSLAVNATCLETPSMVGYRTGMSSQGVIGRRLSSVYGVEQDLPREMHRAISDLHERLEPRR